MTWQDFVNKGVVRTHSTSLAEISDLRAVVARDLTDAALPDLSADRRFLQLTTRCCNFAVSPFRRFSLST